MKRKLIYIQLIIMLLGAADVSSQALSEDLKKSVESPRFMRLMFYNCENLFDTKHDTLKKDTEFLPDGAKYWTYKRYNTKINQICKVITSVGGWESPDIIGLCEVENRQAVLDLLYKTPLYKHEYKFLHKESPDKRGIDVVLLYKPKSFKPLKTEFLEVVFDKNNPKPTRDILYAKGVIKKQDTLHIFVNHWPSRWGGQLETESKRMKAASVVKKKVDSIFAKNPGAFIFITGDLNDEPHDKSVMETLNAKHNLENPKNSNLYNLSYTLQHEYNLGSHKYQGKWGVLDQLIVSGSLLNKQNTVQTSVYKAHIFNAEFLLENDASYLGKKPFRTYAGYRYLGGYSDHLPIFLDLIKK